MTNPSKQNTKQLTIVNKKGMHARASARFVQTASKFDAKIWVSKEKLEVLGTSIMGLLLLAAGKGETITVRTEGKEATKALSAIEKLIAQKFDEDS